MPKVQSLDERRLGEYFRHNSSSRSPEVNMLRGLTLALLFLSTCVVCAAADVGRIENSAGAGVILRDHQVLPITAGTILQLDDIVRTEGGGLIRVTLNDGSALLVSENTELRVVVFDREQEQTLVEMLHGHILVNVAPYTKPGGRFVMRTPTASVLALGTTAMPPTTIASVRRLTSCSERIDPVDLLVRLLDRELQILLIGGAQIFRLRGPVAVRPNERRKISVEVLSEKARIADAQQRFLVEDLLNDAIGGHVAAHAVEFGRLANPGRKRVLAHTVEGVREGLQVDLRRVFVGDSSGGGFHQIGHFNLRNQCRQLLDLRVLLRHGLVGQVGHHGNELLELVDVNVARGDGPGNGVRVISDSVHRLGSLELLGLLAVNVLHRFMNCGRADLYRLTGALLRSRCSLLLSLIRLLIGRGSGRQSGGSSGITRREQDQRE